MKPVIRHQPRRGKDKPYRLGTTVYVVWYDLLGIPEIHKTIVKWIDSYGRPVLLFHEFGNCFVEFEDAYREYVNRMRLLVSSARRHLNYCRSLCDDIPQPPIMRARVDASEPAARHVDPALPDISDMEFGNVEVLSKPAGQPKFLPGQRFFALLLPETCTKNSGMSVSPFSIMETVNKGAHLRLDGSIFYDNASPFQIEEGQMYATFDEAVAGRRLEILRRGEISKRFLDEPVQFLPTLTMWRHDEFCGRTIFKLGLP